MKHFFSTLLLVVISTTFMNCKSHTSIDSYMKELVADGDFNGNVLVVLNGEEVYQNSFGFSDGSKTVKLTKDFRFDLGSVYKEFPAVSIMQLQEKGLLNVEHKINKYLKDLPSWASTISIKNLLQYTSGLPEVEWDKYFEKNERITDEKIKEDLIDIEELEFEPGADYLYTNHSPMLLSQIVEKVTNQTFKVYVTQNLFIPFSLKDAVIHPEAPYLDKSLMAIPFNENYEEDSYKVTISGAIFSLTANDLYNWIENLHSYKIINQESIKFLSEEADFFGNIQSPLGSVEWTKNRIIEHSHHGSAGNYECIVRRFNNDKDVLTIIVQTNQKHENVGDISDEIKNILKFN
ncbi:serine hydrolase domain-containing protein [Zobellia alginiliquefaciens]|uniref:serine hydrolase domain-containing protein n=1 Tax=Zobellia alginiliquefaciens TaxID=3032586 RepID=UPI0023E36325|nr:serine hydrolase domain-containing protein [Zobellia alginiliquefaciens]